MSPADRSTGRGLALETLFEATGGPEGTDSRAAADETAGRPALIRGGDLPADLAARYGDRLEIPLRHDAPTIIANFVTSLDGVVTLGDDTSGGGEISGFFEPDRFVMGLLRTMADAIVVGAGTVRATPTHVWTPGRVNPASAPAYAEWRSALGIHQPQPTTVIVTRSGRLDARAPALTDPSVPVVIVTTAAGASVLHEQRPAAHVRLLATGTGPTVTADALIDVLRSLGVRLALCEGGPHLLGALVAADRLDELFLTEAPQLFGRVERSDRLSFVEGFAAAAGEGRWAELRSVRRAGDHLFLRYRLRPR